MAGAGVCRAGEGDVRVAAARLAMGVAALLATAWPGAPEEPKMKLMTVKDLLDLPRPAPDHYLPYGDHPLQFGELRLPAGGGPVPVAVLIHGGCWLAPYDLGHLSALAAALAAEGVATWSLEYRRLGDAGGGYPATFEDVARGTDALRALAAAYRLDLARVVFVGHSAGGHLALWLAARPNLPRNSPLWAAQPLRPRGVVALAGIPDLAQAAALGVCGDAAERLLGGDGATRRQRLAEVSPAEMLPLGVPVELVTAAHDQVVPAVVAASFAARLAQADDPVRIWEVAGVGHYELVNPASSAWGVVRAAVHEMLGAP